MSRTGRALLNQAPLRFQICREGDREEGERREGGKDRERERETWFNTFWEFGVVVVLKGFDTLQEIMNLNI